MPTANEELYDALIRHQIGLLRFSGHLRNQIHELLDATEADLSEQITRRLASHKGVNSLSAHRVALLRDYITRVRGEAWDKVEGVIVSDLGDLAQREPELSATIVKTVAPVVLEMALPDSSLLKAIVESRPFEGKVLRDWAKTIRQADIDRIQGQINIGLVQGEPARDIARRVVGTARLRGANGVTEITRRQAAALTRTAVNHIGNSARRELFKANADVFSQEVYVATLDSRTTPVCRALDGKRFDVGEGPIPPLHYNCRSLRVALLQKDLIGQRPAKQVTEQGLVREYAKRNGLARVSTRAGLPRGHKGAFDQFARTRIRDLTGPVPAKVTYQQWLTRQSAEFQSDILGPTRARLFREGGLKLDRFVNREGDEIPLHDLARLNREAFIKAGLEPADY